MARISTKLPGEVIAAALKKFGVTVEKLEEVTKIPAEVINAIIDGTEPVTAEISVRLGQALGERDRYFAELQLTHDIIAAAKNVGKIAKLRKPAGKRGRKPGVKAADTAPAKRGRKPKAENTAPAKRGRPVGAKAADTVPAKRGRKPKAENTVPAKRGRKPKAETAAPAKRGRKPGPKPKV
jgi:addiction module HigA family antidote